MRLPRKINLANGRNKGLNPGTLPHQNVGEQEEYWQSGLRGAITKAGGKPNLKCV